MKRTILILLLFLGLSLPAEAQYYGYPTNLLYLPAYYLGGGCLTGCGTGYTVATSLSIGISAANSAVQLHEYTKAQNAQIEYYQAQVEAQKAWANAPQRMIDYYNIQKVAPFFDDTPSKKSKNLQAPTLSIQKTEEVSH